MYTIDEINQTVQTLVQTQLTYQKGKLKSRNLTEQYEGILELVTTSFLYDPDSVIYLIYLSSRNLRQKIVNELNNLETLLNTVDNLYLKDKTITDVSYLANVRSALIQLDGSTSRGGSLGSHSFLRYSQSINAAINKLGLPLKYTHTKRGETDNTTEILTGSKKSKSTILSLLPDLSKLYSDIYSQTVDIDNVYEDFYSSSFLSACNKRQISRALEQITNIDDQMTSRNVIDRSEIASDSLLSLFANKAIVNELYNIKTPADPKLNQPISSDDLYRVSTTGTGTPASVICSEYGPYNLVDGTSRYITVNIDSTYESEIDLLPEGYGCNRATIRSGFTGPFILRGVQDSPGGIGTKEILIGSTFPVVSGENTLHISIDGIPYEVELTVGCTALQLVNDVDLAIGSVVDTYIVSSLTHERVIIDYKLSTSNPDNLDNRSIQLVNGYGSPANGVLGPFIARIDSVSYLLDDPYRVRLNGSNGNNKLHIRANDDIDYEEITLTTGVFPSYTVDSIIIVSDINSVGLTEFGADIEDDHIIIYSKIYGEGSFIETVSDGVEDNINTSSFNCLQTLGFIDGQSYTQFNLSAQKIVDAINATSGFSLYGEAKVYIDNDREYVGIYSLSDGVDSSVRVFDAVAQSAIDSLGFSTDTYYGYVQDILIEKYTGSYWENISLEPFRIKVGDTLIRLSDDTVIGLVSSISNIKNGVLSIIPEVLTTFELNKSSGFKIISTNYLSYLDFNMDIEIWLSNNDDNINQLIDSINKLVNTTPSQQFINLIYNKLSEVYSNLNDLQNIIDNFSVSIIHSVEESLQLLLEKGYDRARSMLVESKIKEFFELTSSTASYSRNLMNAISDITIHDVNERTNAVDNEFVYERLKSTVTKDTSPLSDYSDKEKSLPSPTILDDQERY